MESKRTILFKYGGNAMVNSELQESVTENIAKLRQQDTRVVVVHGGGPFIKQALESAGIESEFIAGQRVTSSKAITYVEMALKGTVNGRLVSLLNSRGEKAVGLSGKDGKMVLGVKRYHELEENGKTTRIDMGHVADVDRVDTTLLDLLLAEDYIPVIACLATDDSGTDYNVNADMMAGHIAGAIKADAYVVLTDVDGLFRDIHDPASIIRQLALDDIDNLKKEGIIAGGMIPKLESCAIALTTGASAALIVNGTKPELLPDIFSHNTIGTRINK